MPEMPDQSGIYEIRNQLNGKIYIGSSVCIRGRIKKHKADLRAGKHHSQKLQRAWLKYGEPAFAFTVVELTPPESLIDREQWWLDGTKAYGAAGYNICPLARSALGSKRTPEQCLKMSVSQKLVIRKPHTDETKRRMSAVRTGRRMSTESRARLSTALKGLPKSAEHRQALSQALTGFKHSAETKRKIGLGAKGRIKSPSECAQISARQKGIKRRPLSAEHRSRIGDAARGRQQSPDWVAKRVATRRRNQLDAALQSQSAA